MLVTFKLYFKEVRNVTYIKTCTFCNNHYFERTGHPALRRRLDRSMGILRKDHCRRDDIESIDRRLKSLEEDTQTIQDATTQLSQNISDKGLVLVLLPPAKEEKLTNTVGAIKDALTTAEQTLSSLIDTLTFIDSLPLISVPKPDPDTVSAVAARVDKLNTTIDNTRARMQEARDNSAGAAQKISDATGEVNNAITEIRSELDARSQKLSATQDSLSSFAQSLPFWVYLGTLLVTLVLGWVIYTQVLIIQFALAKFKAA
jgi:chromosome segregation ATPase